MLNRIKIASDIISNIRPEESVILSHADHDGFSSSVLLNTFFLINYKKKAITLYPTEKIKIEYLLYKINEIKPKYLLIVDLPLIKYKKYLINIIKNTIVINFDHHDIININNDNFIDLNPHNWNETFLNSSGLVWLVLKNINKNLVEERAWVAGIGAVQDYCIEGNYNLFKAIQAMGLISNLNFYDILNSELMILAKIIRSSLWYFNADQVYDAFLKASIQNNYKTLYTNDIFISSYRKYKTLLNFILNYFKRNVNILNLKYIIKIINLSRIKNISINIISDVSEVERDQAIYVAYKDGRLSFRALYVNYDVRNLAKYFGGGGANPRAAGAHTRFSYNQVINKIINYFSTKKLTDYY